MFQIFTDWGKFQLNIQIEESFSSIYRLRKVWAQYTDWGIPPGRSGKSDCQSSLLLLCSVQLDRLSTDHESPFQFKMQGSWAFCMDCNVQVWCAMCNVQVWCVSGTAAWRHSLLVGATTRETSFVQNASDHHNAWLQCGNVWLQRKTSLKSWPCKLFVHFVKTYHYRIWIRIITIVRVI